MLWINNRVHVKLDYWLIIEQLTNCSGWLIVSRKSSLTFFLIDVSSVVWESCGTACGTGSAWAALWSPEVPSQPGGVRGGTPPVTLLILYFFCMSCRFVRGRLTLAVRPSHGCCHEPTLLIRVFQQPRHFKVNFPAAVKLKKDFKGCDLNQAIRLTNNSWSLFSQQWGNSFLVKGNLLSSQVQGVNYSCTCCLFVQNPSINEGQTKCLSRGRKTSITI